MVAEFKMFKSDWKIWTPIFPSIYIKNLEYDLGHTTSTNTEFSDKEPKLHIQIIARHSVTCSTYLL